MYSAHTHSCTFYLFSDESLEGVKPALGDRTSWESKGLDSGGGEGEVGRGNMQFDG